MKKILLIAFSCLIPSAHAVDYVKCEAIRAVIARNEIQKENATEEAKGPFKIMNLREKYPKVYSGCISLYGTSEYKECQNFEKFIFTTFSTEFNEYKKSKLKPYVEINTRATKDFDKNGCYWF